MALFAEVDGNAVPTHLSPQQISVLFPGGILGLRRANGGGPIFPDESGSVQLTAGERYTFSGSVEPSTGGLGWGAASSLLSMPSGSRCMLGHSPLMLNASGSMLAADRLFPFTPSDPEQIPMNAQRGKLMLDRVHEHVLLPPLVVAIIDTPEFQRLRFLKQLGLTWYLYPGATHTRFEHCIGVCHLAGELVKKLARRQPNLQITDSDILCVMVAGVCHDLGHGPFSHLFERMINQIQAKAGHPVHFEHEAMSIVLFRRIVQKIQAEEQFGLTAEDLRFVELLITGLKPGAQWPTNIGRPQSKRFLADISANKRNGVDVDKLDYFMRDSMCCYGRPTIDCYIPRLFSCCQAMEGPDGEMQICYEEKMAVSLGEIFALRAKLYKHAYVHRIARSIDYMMTDILELAEPHFTLAGEGDKNVRISECLEDVEGFIRLGDWIFNAIAASTDPKLRPARNLIDRINSRRLYRLVGIAMFADCRTPTSIPELTKELLSEAPRDSRDQLKSNLIVDIVSINYGSTDKFGLPDDPINGVCFYNPKNLHKQAVHLPFSRQSPLFRPQQFGEKSMVILVRKDDCLTAAMTALEKWKKRNESLLAEMVPTFNPPQSPAREGSAKRPRE